MGYAQKRLASTAAKLVSVPASHLKAFPPKEAFLAGASASKTVTPTSKPKFFDAESWASVQPPHPAALTAFAHRIGLGTAFSTPDIIQQACTHPSFIPLYERHNPSKPLPIANGNLSTLGNSLLGLFATEHVNSSYPHLPTRVLKAAVSAYVGPPTCAAIAREWGASPLLRWNRIVSIKLFTLIW